MTDTVLRKLEKLVGGLFVAQSTFVTHISTNEEELRVGKDQMVFDGSVLMMVRATKGLMRGVRGGTDEICVYADYVDLRTNCKIRVIHYSDCAFLSLTVDKLFKRVL